MADMEHLDPPAETLPFPVKITRWPRDTDGAPDIVAHVLGLAAQPWALASVYRTLKKAGRVFPGKVEAEMAVALHFLLVHVLRDPVDGLDNATAELKAMLAAVEKPPCQHPDDGSCANCSGHGED